MGYIRADEKRAFRRMLFTQSTTSIAPSSVGNGGGADSLSNPSILLQRKLHSSKVSANHPQAKSFLHRDDGCRAGIGSLNLLDSAGRDVSSSVPSRRNTEDGGADEDCGTSQWLDHCGEAESDATVSGSTHGPLSFDDIDNKEIDQSTRFKACALGDYHSRLYVADFIPADDEEVVNDTLARGHENSQLRAAECLAEWQVLVSKNLFHLTCPDEGTSVSSLIRRLKSAVKKDQKTFFQTETRRVLRLRSRLDKLYRAFVLCPGFEPRKLSLMNMIAKGFGKLEKLSNRLFALFCSLIGVHGVTSYDKAKMDVAIEDCFGSVNNPCAEGRGFHYQGCHIDNIDYLETQRIFSVYLGRKVFCPSNPLENEKKIASFLTRVTTVPPHIPEIESDKRQALNLFRIIIESLFVKGDFDPLSYAPTHGSGCVECPRSKGGKREYFYSENVTYKRECVFPEAVYTGGKTRIITLDSAYNMKYASLNKWMASCVRQCTWSVFGRSVESWLAGNRKFPREGWFLSGDLESATELFFSDFANLVIDHICTIWDANGEDNAQMRLFTTSAEFSPGQLQRRGQLMGSILSFPILCVISLVTGILNTKHHNAILSRTGIERNRYIRRDIHDVGVNGDDIVLCESDSKRWERSVRAVGGKVSRGKSLLSRRVMTINSEIWYSHAGELLPPACLRPSLIFSLGGTLKFPHASWREYDRSPLLGKDLRELIDIDNILNVDLPVSLGGLGEVVSPRSDSLIRRILRARIFRENLETGIVKAPYGGPVHGKKVLVRGERELVKSLVRETYENQGLPSWTPSSTPIQQLDDADQKSYEQMKFITEGEKQMLYESYLDEFLIIGSGDLIATVPLSLIEGKPIVQLGMAYKKTFCSSGG